ncbi:MAG: DUF4097 family beta strand repeat protein [Lachnospiraceae bacterium]|nr:DUF4097 family beta strand repeat protein [Lachnospiraceae bacterium]
MSKSSRIALLAIGAGIILIGLGFILTRGNMKAFASKKTNAARTKYDYECTGKITAVDLEELYEGAIITTGDVKNATVTYYVYEDQDVVNVDESNGTLSFTRKEIDKGFFKINFFNFDFESTKTVITLPKDFEGPVKAHATSGSIDINDLKNSSLDVKTSSGSSRVDNIEKTDEVSIISSSGSIKVNGITSTGDVTIISSSGSNKASSVKCKDFSSVATSGSVTAEDIECDNLSTKSSSGSVKVANATVRNNLETGASSGSVRVTESSAADIKGKTSSGSINFSNTSADTAYAECTSGGIRLEGLDVAKSAEFKSNSGSVSGSLKGKESDFSIVTSTTSGSCNLKGSREGDKKLDVSTTSGSIHIKFE